MSDEQAVRPVGVLLAPPPPVIYDQITEAVEAYASSLRPTDHGGIIGVATTKGVNLAIVQRIGKKSTVVGWIGKPSGWGAPIEGGLAWKMRW